MQKIEELYQQKIKDLIKKGVLIDPSQEEVYLKKHKLKLTRYENGSRYIGLLAKRDDIKKASININFTVGSNKNPKGKEGLVHLLEHLFFSEKFEEFFNVNQSWCNASTNSDLVTFAFGGNVNYKYPTFSLPSVIDEAFGITKKLHGLDILSNFEKTKQTIENEIENYEANFDRQSMDKFRELIFSEDSNQVIDTLGNKNSLKNISVDDVKSFFAKYFTAENTVSSAFVEGGEDEFDLVTGLADKNMRFLTRGKTNITPAHQMMKDHLKINFPFNSAKVDRKNLALKNKLISTVSYIKIDIPKYSVHEKALGVISFILSEKLIQLSRIEGLSYRISSDYFHTMNDECVIYVRSVDGNDNWDEKFQKFQNFIEKFMSELHKFEYLFKNELEMEIIRQKAIPVSRATTLNSAMGSLINYDHISNVDNSKKLFLEVTMDHINEILEKIKNTKPNYFSVGDFK